MPLILPIGKKIHKQIKKYSLQKKFDKQTKLLILNPNHPSLNLEILEPKHRCVYSFRLDRKFRALCLFDIQKQTIEIIKITVHYQ